ncbi:MAG: pyridoxine 5'-phosphate synthase [Desulfobacterota bacterium]|nr:pyridoxine 5'-phosphate synthase [Thermodesulfobacteriota bacterium]
MAKLSVNVDHVATLREARGGLEPDPIIAAALAELAGCDGIIVHLREDRRHINDRDVELLRQTVKTKLNLEMAATEEMIEIALRVKPDMCTLVPEKRQELTTEGGLDLIRNFFLINEPVTRLQRGGILVSLFIDPDPEQINAAKKMGTDYVEIHTGIYSNAKTPDEIEQELKKVIEAVQLSAQLRLGVNAGHGLNYQNIKPLTKIKEIDEFSIGHSIISRAVLVGLEQAVREMKEIIKQNCFASPKSSLPRK